MVFRVVGSATTTGICAYLYFIRVALAIGQPPLPWIQRVLSMNGYAKEITATCTLVAYYPFFLKK